MAEHIPAELSNGSAFVTIVALQYMKKHGLVYAYTGSNNIGRTESGGHKGPSHTLKFLNQQKTWWWFK